jgi:Zn-finger protein
MLLNPVKKDNKYVLHPESPIKKYIIDVKIKSIRKLINNKGYNIVIYISSETNGDVISELIEFDKQVIDIIENKSSSWFGKTFTTDEIAELYNRSFCKQTKTMNIILTDKQLKSILYNGKHIADSDTIVQILKDNNHFKKCIINIALEYCGLYIYSETTSNKWIIKTLDVTDINIDHNDWITNEDIIDKIEERIAVVKRKTRDKIVQLKKHEIDLSGNISLIDIMLADIKAAPSHSKNINGLLNKLNEFLISQEDKIML